MEKKDQPILVALGKSDRKELEQLADHWRTSLAEAIRRAVRETWEKLR